MLCRRDKLDWVMSVEYHSVPWEILVPGLIDSWKIIMMKSSMQFSEDITWLDLRFRNSNLPKGCSSSSYRYRLHQVKVMDSDLHQHLDGGKPEPWCCCRGSWWSNTFLYLTHDCWLHLQNVVLVPVVCSTCCINVCCDLPWIVCPLVNKTAQLSCAEKSSSSSLIDQY